MDYYTTVKVVNKEGKPIKSEVSCGGTYRGYTDATTGEIHFNLSSDGWYNVSAKRSGKSTSGKVQGGREITLREK